MRKPQRWLWKGISIFSLWLHPLGCRLSWERTSGYTSWLSRGGGKGSLRQKPTERPLLLKELWEHLHKHSRDETQSIARASLFRRICWSGTAKLTLDSWGMMSYDPYGIRLPFIPAKHPIGWSHASLSILIYVCLRFSLNNSQAILSHITFYYKGGGGGEGGGTPTLVPSPFTHLCWFTNDVHEDSCLGRIS